jgi:hypothetical protein
VKSFRKIFSGGLILAYVAVSLITLSNCTKTNDSSTVEQLKSAKQKIANLLMQKFDAEIFCAGSEQILNHPVLLDSTLIGITKKDGGYLLKAQINAGDSKKYFAELKCSREIADSYSRTKSNSVFIVAKISRIDDYLLLAEADSLDGKRSQFNIGKSILLSGECLALAEIPAAINAN